MKNKVGSVFINKIGQRVEVIEYFNADNCTIKYDDGTIVENSIYRKLKYGSFIKPLNRIGEVFKSNQGYELKILKYNNAKNCSVLINNHCIVNNLKYSNIKKGEVNYPYFKSVYSIGYFGEGVYLSSIDGKSTKYYTMWCSMFGRCYSKMKSAYKGCIVCEEWHNFQNFAKWYEDNYNPETMQDWELDKDILIKGNKIYSPDTCCFVPQEINKLFTKTNAKRGNYPIGVIKSGKNFISKITKGDNKRVYIGSFDTPEEAFQAYKVAKEKHIKEKADKWKDFIDPRVYQAMYNYEVEITD